MAQLDYDTKTAEYESALVIGASFYESLDALARDGLVVIPAWVNARLRRELGRGAPISLNGNYAAQGILRTPSGLYFTNNSPVLAHPREATAAHSQRKPYLATAEDSARALEDAVRITRPCIPVDELANDPVGQFLFNKEAGPYGEFLHKAGIPKIIIRVSGFDPDGQFLFEEGEADQLWFGGLDDRSVLDGGRNLCLYDYDVRGVRGVTSAAGGARR